MNEISRIAAGFRVLDATRHQGGARRSCRQDIAEETPIGLVYNDTLFAVMMASPLDLEDFAYGFSLTEGLVGDVDELYLAGIEPTSEEDGFRLFMAVPTASFAKAQAARRDLTVGSGCGLCGVSSFAEALRPLPPVTSPLRIPPAAITNAVAALPTVQTLNRRVKAVHAAAFAGPDGHILAVREDVGRHNALDKLIGHLVREGIDPGSGFAVMSSRCSFELVHKAAAAGIPLIATISAPTSLAAEFAHDVKLTIASSATDDGFTVYSTPERLKS
ncbi:MAG: formate dehydrogenase accessory sulfurtransferase FdhD [Rhodospirillaceae bacterium]|nr:formate dehydrogenase accessory sulfurtransferase FdhD [Rhodospirillaceae bacterium]